MNALLRLLVTIFMCMALPFVLIVVGLFLKNKKVGISLIVVGHAALICVIVALFVYIILSLQ